VEEPRIPCTLPEIFRRVKAGERVRFDDGKLGGEVISATPDALRIRITEPASGARKKLRAGKGINFPDTDLDLPSLTEKDLEDLEFVVEHADIVGLSFVNRGEDIEHLQRNIFRNAARPIGVILKIETQRAFENLPSLLLTGLRSNSVGVMIARGDLAAECGFERMAELQEEILWVCEAAHVPVIWATQVLETMSKKGIPSRAEITDAAMAERAECVMLNKGPHIVEAVRVLDDIVGRMKSHQNKKSSKLRALRISRLRP
jgi:pyruvate kinase